MFCSGCGQQLEENAEFCTNCGKNRNKQLNQSQNQITNITSTVKLPYKKITGSIVLFIVITALALMFFITPVAIIHWESPHLDFNPRRDESPARMFSTNVEISYFILGTFTKNSLADFLSHEFRRLLDNDTEDLIRDFINDDIPGIFFIILKIFYVPLIIPILFIFMLFKGNGLTKGVRNFSIIGFIITAAVIAIIIISNIYLNDMLYDAMYAEIGESAEAIFNYIRIEIRPDFYLWLQGGMYAVFAFVSHKFAG